MKTILRRHPGFFIVSNGFVADLGPEWPDLAEVALKRPRAAVVYGRSNAVVIDGGRLEDALADGEAAITGKRAKAAIVGRAVGRFGDSILYERSADLCAEGCEDQLVLPAPAKYVGDKETKAVHMRIVKANGSSRRIEGLASTPNVDRDYDVVEPTAFNESLIQFMQNPMMLLNHMSDCPIGKVVEFQVRKEGLWVAGEIAKGTTCADETWALIQQDVLRTFSVQFIILEREIVQEADGEEPGVEYPEGDVTVDPSGMDPSMDQGGGIPIRRITKAELLEVSVVSIPCNREAVFSVAKSLKAGTDVTCAVCKLTDCECAEARAVLEYRQTKVAAPAVTVERGRDAITKALGRDADRLAGLVQRPGAAQFKHHGVQDGELVLDVAALRCAMGSLVAYTDQGGEPLTEAERKAAYHHLARHCADAGLKPPALGKGPRGEGMAEALAGAGAVVVFAKDDGYERQGDSEKWLVTHGFAGTVRDGGTEWVFGTRGAPADRSGTYQLDKGVQAVVYRPHASKEATTVTDEKKPETTQAAPAVPPATPAAPAATPPAAPAAAQAPAKEPDEERTVEIELDDLNALTAARDVANGKPGAAGPTLEALEHAFANVEISSA